MSIDPDEIIEDEEEVFTDEDDVEPPRATNNERAIHRLLVATYLRAELDGREWLNKDRVMEVDTILKQMIRAEVRTHPRDPYHTEQVWREELRKLDKQIHAIAKTWKRVS